MKQRSLWLIGLRSLSTVQCQVAWQRRMLWSMLWNELWRRHRLKLRATMNRAVSIYHSIRPEWHFSWYKKFILTYSCFWKVRWCHDKSLLFTGLTPVNFFHANHFLVESEVDKIEDEDDEESTVCGQLNEDFGNTAFNKGDSKKTKSNSSRSHNDFFPAWCSLCCIVHTVLGSIILTSHLPSQWTRKI